MSSQRKKDNPGASDTFYTRLFRDGHLFGVLSEEMLSHAREMEQLGIVELKAIPYVKCMNFKDRDIRFAHKRHCQGILPFMPLKKHDDRLYYCPDCGREIYPYGKQSFTGWRVVVNMSGVNEAVRKRLSGLGWIIKEICFGVVQAACESSEIHACIWDCCDDLKFKSPLAPSSYNIFYVYVDREQAYGSVPAGAKSAWLKDFLTCADVALQGLLLSSSSLPATDIKLTDFIEFQNRERVREKPSYTFNKKTAARMIHDVVMSEENVIIDGFEVISRKSNPVSYRVFRFLAEKFIEDTKNGCAKYDFRTFSVTQIGKSFPEERDDTTVRKAINRLKEEFLNRLSEEFHIPYERDEIIETAERKIGYRLNPKRIAVTNESTKSQ